jgi:hypothetical protein
MDMMAEEMRWRLGGLSQPRRDACLVRVASWILAKGVLLLTNFM